MLAIISNLHIQYLMTDMSSIDALSQAVESSNIHEGENGYTGNCANIAVAIKEIALEEYEDDLFRFAVIDRPSRLDIGVGGPDHVAVEYNSKYLDSKGIHSREEIIDLIQGDQKGNRPMLQIESASFIKDIPYYNEDTKERIKLKIKDNL